MITEDKVGRKNVYNSVLQITSDYGGFHKHWLVDWRAGRFLKGSPCLQQEEFQPVPCRPCVQSIEPKTVRVPPDMRVPLRTDHCHGENKYPPSLPSPTVGQKECSEEEGTGSRRGRESSTSTQNCKDR